MACLSKCAKGGATRLGQPEDDLGGGKLLAEIVESTVGDGDLFLHILNNAGKASAVGSMISALTRPSVVLSSSEDANIVEEVAPCTMDIILSGGRAIHLREALLAGSDHIPCAKRRLRISFGRGENVSEESDGENASAVKNTLKEARVVLGQEAKNVYFSLFSDEQNLH